MLYYWHSPWAIYLGGVVLGLVGIVANMSKAVLQYGIPKPHNRAGHFTMQLLTDYGTGAIGAIGAGFLIDALLHAYKSPAQAYHIAFGIGAVAAFIYYPIMRWMISPLSDKVDDYS
jgi:hypothetical protein